MSKHHLEMRLYKHDLERAIALIKSLWAAYQFNDVIYKNAHCGFYISWPTVTFRGPSDLGWFKLSPEYAGLKIARWNKFGFTYLRKTPALQLRYFKFMICPRPHKLLWSFLKSCANVLANYQGSTKRQYLAKLLTIKKKLDSELQDVNASLLSLSRNKAA